MRICGPGATAGRGVARSGTVRSGFFGDGMSGSTGSAATRAGAIGLRFSLGTAVSATTVSTDAAGTSAGRAAEALRPSVRELGSASAAGSDTPRGQPLDPDAGAAEPPDADDCSAARSPAAATAPGRVPRTGSETTGSAESEVACGQCPEPERGAAEPCDSDGRSAAHSSALAAEAGREFEAGANATCSCAAGSEAARGPRPAPELDETAPCEPGDRAVARSSEVAVGRELESGPAVPCSTAAGSETGRDQRPETKLGATAGRGGRSAARSSDAAPTARELKRDSAIACSAVRSEAGPERDAEARINGAGVREATTESSSTGREAVFPSAAGSSAAVSPATGSDGAREPRKLRSKGRSIRERSKSKISTTAGRLEIGRSRSFQAVTR
jgi:hypothetical protein